MRRWSWLTTLSSLLVGIVPGQWLTRLRKPSPIRPCRQSTAGPERKDRLTREDVLRMIEKNSGPRGLDLSAANLRNLDLSGMDLHGVCLRDADIRQSKLEGTWLAKSDLQNADMWSADLRGACLWKADLDGADLKECDLRGAFLVDASLRDTLLAGSYLQGAFLHRAVFSNTSIGRQSIGVRLLMESERSLVEFADNFDSWFMQFRQDPDVRGWVAKSIPVRHRLAKETYLSLKNNFAQVGRYSDASWAYIKERQMSKNMHWPPTRLRACYAEELAKLAPNGLLHIWHLARFYAKHLFWHLADWTVELTCGYGEKPLRTLVCALAVILIFPVLYWLSGGIAAVNTSTLTWLDYLNYSFGAFTTIGFARFETASWVAETLTSIEALLGISVLALLMFTLGNRISRS